MKKKIMALTLSAALVLSSTTAFAADTATCTKGNYDLNSILKQYNLNNSNLLNQFKFTINGKSIDLSALKSKLANIQTVNSAQTKPAAVKPATPVAVKPATPVATKPATPVATKPAAPVATKPAAPVATKPATPVATKPAAPVATKPATPSNTTVSSSNLTYEQKVAELVNIERQKNGVPALTLDSSISNVARTKSKDMAVNNYFSHQSPTYGMAGDMLRQFGINWSAWGENIASGQKTPEAVVTAWMNSPGHRANILSTNFSNIGVGYATNSNGTAYWTQMFTN
jgi:uncharacterized YkwD family protein